ncbi:putative GPI anchor protein [Phytophthora cinnamomi]|uniref:putative GPI anchor protein n=1 Tax=Phytophthora cinnamomi TaxID=4785 RepID=UPI00355A2D38|nr:putative GPI anchor protein [Phytophthora cinnamomi]
MKVYGMFLMAAAMASAVSAGAGKLCDMDPAPAVTPAPLPATEAPASPATEAPASPATEAPATEAPVAQTTEAPSTETEAPVTQDDTTQQQQQQSSTSAAGSDATQQSTTQQSTIAGGEQTTAGTVSSAYSYTGANCGGPGSYDQVTNIASCSKSTVTTSSPVSPFDTGVTVAFRGPMTIHNIAVFDGTNGTWCKVSDYENGGAATNMVFLNNENVDYTGAGSPEGFCKADGTGVAKQSTPFGGTLASASNPGKSILASENTGAEVHIMTDKQCGVDAQCEGAYDTDGTAFQGWTGGKKIFLTKVTMAEGGTPNVPAVWMLPDQVTHSGQYGCNCRGTGPAGGCGELDIAEVLEKDTSYVATHYYFYDGKYNPGNDQFAKRPTDGPATYVTIIDQDYGVKVLALGADDFDFSCGTISSDVVSQWEAAE